METSNINITKKLDELGTKVKLNLSNILQVDIEEISQGLQFVCNDLLWLQEPVRAAKILMRCQTTNLYSTGLQKKFLFTQ